MAVPLLAGCSDDDGNGDDGVDDDDGNGENDLEAWFEDTPNFEEVEDFTGEEEVRVENGLSDEYDTYVFEPPAIRVDAGTTVVWEWVDDDTHTVTHEDGAFDSDNVQGRGETFEHTFDDEGTYRYFCRPHRGMGQKGAVVVE